ncbi:MAG: HAMP domain-containing histidine kinase [Algicola sp.]|nr:HAMP domain-containing histidine kinase [Algicola sp.]
MSIKRYLFILIGSIVLVVAAIQLLLIAYFKQHLNEEITHKSQQLSTKIIDFAVEKVNLAEIIHTSSELRKRQANQQFDYPHDELTEKDSSNCVMIRSVTRVNEKGEQINESVKVECNDQVTVMEFNSKPSTKVRVKTNINGTTFSDDEIKRQKIRWKTQLHKIIKEEHNNEQSNFVFVTNHSFNTANDNKTEHQVLIDTLTGQQPSAIETLIDDMIMVILLSSMVALLLAFWLSNHFTRPLQHLSHGFAALEKGELGVQVKVAGINEYRKTIHSFNQMSLRLARLAQSEKTLQQQGHLAELGEVSRGLAHALRNPMHTIGLSVEQLKDPDLPEKLKLKLQGKIEAKIKHIDKTIKALLTLTSGEITRDEDVPMRSVIQDVVLEMKSTDPNVKLSLDAANITIKGAESEIRAIIHTLIVNAVESNNGQGNVDIKLTHNDEAIKVEVTDQGAGIAASVAQRLFQPHVSSKAEGAGMGLYISRRLATLYYNGDVTLRNGSKGGCVACLILQKTASQKGSNDE